MRVKVIYLGFVGELTLYVVRVCGPTLLGAGVGWSISSWHQTGAYNTEQTCRTYWQAPCSLSGHRRGDDGAYSATDDPARNTTPCLGDLTLFRSRSKTRWGRSYIVNHLEEAGILRKVEHATWATPIVTVHKKNGDIRICGDYKLTINPYLSVDQYLLPKPANLMTCLTGGKQFSKLDLRSPYQQMTLDEAPAEPQWSIYSTRAAWSHPWYENIGSAMSWWSIHHLRIARVHNQNPNVALIRG